MGLFHLYVEVNDMIYSLSARACNCNTHARRSFVDILDDYPEECQYVISEVFEEIYRNDAIAKDSKMSPDERLKYHQENSGPNIQAMKDQAEA